MQRILITGGAGFIGSAVIQELLRVGYYVSVVDDFSFGNVAFLPATGISLHRLDILDREGLAQVFEQERPDFVVHLAAIHFIPYCNAHPFKSANINIQGTKNVLELAAQHQVKKVFFASTAAVYPIIDEPITETHPTGPLDIYGLSKLTGEYLCQAFYQEHGIPTVICRFFNAFGPNETNPHLIPAIEDQLREGKRRIALGNLEPMRDFIHTADMARAVRMLLEADLPGCDVFNLGRGIEYSVSEVVAAFESALGESIEIEQDPERMRPSDRMHLLADNAKLRQAVGWEPEKSLEEGVATLVANWTA